ncbi:MAG: DUF2264 domain-containing protein [Bacteroidota bacterium]|nr:DUF2264 domain-containing protein [Bacteroidota bacterium]
MKKIIHTLLLLVLLPCAQSASAAPDSISLPGGAKERTYLVSQLTHIADPVLLALSRNELKATMPVEARAGQEADRKKYTYLEAFGRLVAGMAPWLELGPGNNDEGRLREKYILLVRKCLHNATDPQSPDFMNFNNGSQPVVDAAFLAQALLRAPTQLWDPLDSATKTNVINAFVSSRVITPGFNNWLLFSAEVEAFLIKATGQGDKMRIDYAVRQMMEWYKGDGLYGDGADFHFDYYNSYVIHPMLLDVLQVMKEQNKYADFYDRALKRSQRYAEILERLISPDAIYPAIGRSLAYRFGAFQVLGEIALMHQLKEIDPQQVRSALYAVIKNQVEAPGTFDKNGWLQIGFHGHQPGIGEGYISTGSLYLCSEGFLILGLPADDLLWTRPDEEWTQLKASKGESFPIDHAISD